MGTIVSSLPNPGQWVATTPQPSFTETFRTGMYDNAKKDRPDSTFRANARSPGIFTQASKNGSTPGILKNEFRENIQAANEQNGNKPKQSSKLYKSRKDVQSSSRLPTPVKARSESNQRNSNLNDVTENDLDSCSVSRRTIPDSNTQDEANATLQKADNANSNSERPFNPEPWPVVDMIFEHLDKRQSCPTTVIFAKFLPRNSKNHVEIKYSTSKETGETLFEVDGRLDSIVPLKDGVTLGDSQKEQIDFFFGILKTAINLLEGQVWWNGFSLIFEQKPTTKRLKISGFETEPSQVLFELLNMADLQVHRTSHKVELQGKTVNASDDELKYFRIRGVNVRDVKVSKLRGNLVTVHLPDFCPEFIPLPR